MVKLKKKKVRKAKNPEGRAMGRPKKSTIVRNRLTELRERHKKDGGLYLTLAEVANFLGKSESIVSLQENMRRRLTDQDVAAYARLYKVRETDLFVGLTENSSDD